MSVITRSILVLVPALVAAATVPTRTPNLIDRGYREMYNLQFADAHQSFSAWTTQHPDDPLGPVSAAAAYLFSEFDRLHILQAEFFVHEQHFMTDNKLTPDPVLKRKFYAALQSSRALADAHPDDPNAMFAAVLCNGLESDYLALIEKRYTAALRQMKTGRTLAQRLLAADPSYHDAWIAVGVENYVLSAKPAPIRWALRLGGAQTDRGLGIEKLQLTAQKGRLLAPFAKLLLAVAAMRDKDTVQARALLSSLAEEYPKNPLYRQELARLEQR